MSQCHQIAAADAERINSFCAFGMQATKTLQALCHLLGHVKPTAERNASRTAADLAQAVSGMLDHLQVIEDAFDNICVSAPPDQEQEERTETDTTDVCTEPALTA